MKKIILVPLAVVVFSCNSTKTATGVSKPTTETKDQAVKYEILTESAYQGREEKSFEVIKDNASLLKLYQGINDAKVPKVDFSKSRIVALFLGQRNSGGYSINVKNIEEKGDKIIITTQEIAPDGMAIMSITNPFTILKINSTKEIVIL